MDGLWEKANQISEVAYKIHGLSSVAGMLGEALEDDMNSGVAWVLYEDLRRYSDDLEGLVSDIMAINRAEKTPKKGKKNKVVEDDDGRC